VNVYQFALDVQNACNLSGVVLSLAKLMEQLCDDCRASSWVGPRNEWLRNHPALRLYLDKVNDMMGRPDLRDDSFERFGKAYDACQALAKDPKPWAGEVPS
jgi:hypothetical protein